MDIVNKEKLLQDIQTDFDTGIKLMNQVSGKSITIFGSARIKSDKEAYMKTKRWAKEIVENNYNVITGGGPGIMEAANMGASVSDNDTKSIGMGIRLPFEEKENQYIDISGQFKYFFSRKVMLINYSDAYLAFDGGFGTLDEIFEVLTLMQTKKIKRSKIFLIGIDFYQPLYNYIKDVLLKNGTINEKDMELIEVTEDIEVVLEYLKQKN